MNRGGGLGLSRHQLDMALIIGQPGGLERLAYWLDLDIKGPSDEDAHEALVEYMTLGVYLYHPED